MDRPSDDEAELLLTVTQEYKVQKSSENVDWESVKSKYEDILALLIPRPYPESSWLCYSSFHASSHRHRSLSGYCDDL